MIDPEQNKEPVFYGIDQMQRTNQNQLMQIEERHGDLQRLEKDIVQLNEIHREFAEIVSDHGGIIDNIESSVSQTVVNVDKAARETGKAVDLQSAVRRKKIICGLIIFIVIAVAIIIAVVVVIKHKP